MSIPLVNPRRVSITLYHFGKKGGAYQFTKVLIGFLVSRGWEFVKESKNYVTLIPPAGVKKPFRLTVEIPTREQVEELARERHADGRLWAAKLGEWPAIYYPHQKEAWRSSGTFDPFSGEQLGSEVTTGSTPARLHVGYRLFWDAEVIFFGPGHSYHEAESEAVRPDPPSLFDAEPGPSDRPEIDAPEELPATEGDATEDHPYTPNSEDTRKTALRSMKARRGQQQFREALRTRYGDRCQISGCGLLDVLEAAHVKPYRGDNDHNPANGLLLRSDLHTLFDLDLIGVEPETLTVRVHPQAAAEYGSYDGKKLICDAAEPSREALSLRWAEYSKKLPD